MRARWLWPALAVALLGASTTTNGVISGTIVADCKISSSTLSFGSYDPLIANATTPLNATGSVLVSCTRGATGVTVSLDAGSNATRASGTSRAMSDGLGDYLSYEIYTTSAMTTVWNTTNLVSYTSVTSMAQTALTAYGQIPAGQSVPVATYTDSVIATVNF